MDVSAFDQPWVQTQIGPVTGERILPDEGNELLGGVVSVICSHKHIWMTRCADKNNPQEMGICVTSECYSRYVRKADR
jgi:hypothetical protein